MTMNNVRRLCVFAHYDRDGMVDDYVYFYLKALLQVCSKIIFVSVSLNNDDDFKSLEGLGIEVVVRGNTGYDFYSYKVGLARQNVSQYDEVVICNDSVYGPFVNLSGTFEEMDKRECDFWGVTDSYQRKYHIQSYFLVFKNNVSSSDVFKCFWEGLEKESLKARVVDKYEIGLSQRLIRFGFKSDCIYKSEKNKSFKNMVNSLFRISRVDIKKQIKNNTVKNTLQKLVTIGNVNPTHKNWKETLSKKKSPFIKVELLRDNPAGVNDKDDIISYINRYYNYPVSLISEHLERMKSSCAPRAGDST